MQKCVKCGNIISKINGREVLVVSNRRIVCPSCNTIFSEKLLQERKSEGQCLVCGASLNVYESESAPEEELVDWYYYEWKTNDSYFIIEKLEADKQNLSTEDEDIILKYTFKAPPRDESGSSKAAKEVLRREYKPDAFMETETSKTMTMPDPVVRCPRCGSTSIQLVPKKWSPLTGFRTNSVMRVCVNCKHRF